MGLKFDPTINYGHVLSMILLLASVFGVYATLDKRVVVLEVAKTANELRASELQAEQKEAIREIRSDVKEVQRSLNEISRNLNRSKP